MTKPTDPPRPAATPATPDPQRTWKRSADLLGSELQDFTRTWLKTLPDDVRPMQCAEHYARVLNKIAALWSLNERCMDYLDELLIDKRGGRQGFGHGVLPELRRLRHHRAAMLPPSDAMDNGFAATQPLQLPDHEPPLR